MTDRLLDLTVDCLAVARLTKLATTDSMPPLVKARQAAYTRIRERHGTDWAEGVQCDWCVSMYLAAAAVLARRVAPRTWHTAARALAASYAAGWLNNR